MPTVFRTNNAILPANARAADVAERAVQEIVPVQQRRYMSAFRVQGIECVAYNRLTQGRKCTCVARGKAVRGLLNEEGKADSATINGIINGRMEFTVTDYDEGYDKSKPDQSSPWAGNKNQGVFDRVAAPAGEPFARDVPVGDPAFGDDGPLQGVDLDELLGDFDTTAYGVSDVACPVCFGTGFIGGYSAFAAYRHVMNALDVVAQGDAELDLTAKPAAVRSASGFQVRTILPRGAIAVDSFKVYNMLDPVGFRFTIDGSVVQTDHQLLSFCDGQPHLIAVTFARGPSDFTHMEIQFATSTESLYFEFPKRPSSSDTSLLERMEPFRIVLSPNIQQLSEMDVVVESQLGKTLVVQNVNPWQTRQLNVLGPECQVRVIQPQEIYRILPQRARIRDMQPSTKMVRDNVNGVFRT